MIAHALASLALAAGTPTPPNPGLNECVAVVGDVLRLDPTFLEPVEGAPRGGTVVLLCGESDTVDDLYTMRLDREAAETLLPVLEAILEAD